MVVVVVGGRKRQRNGSWGVSVAEGANAVRNTCWVGAMGNTICAGL